MVLYATEDIPPYQHILYSYGPNYGFIGERIKISDLKYEDGLNRRPEDQENIEKECDEKEYEYPVYK